MLLPLHGRSLLEHVWQRALRSGLPVLIAACEDEVADAARAFGADVVMTEPGLPSGSDRVAAAARHLDAQVVINVQADMPLLDPVNVRRLAAAFEDPTVRVATLAVPVDADPGPSAVKVVCDESGDALYFSRSPIPHRGPFLRHLGLYGFRREALFDFVDGTPGALEQRESLEQLRMLERGCPIRVLLVDSGSPSVDTPEDLEQVRLLLERP